MTREEEAMMNLSYILVEYPETSARGKAVLTAIEALAKIEAIQEVIDMPPLWESDDRRRYAKIVDIVRKDITQEVEAKMEEEKDERQEEQK